MVKIRELPTIIGKGLAPWINCLDNMLPEVIGQGFESPLGWLCSSCVGDSEDSDSRLQKGLVPKRDLVPL